MYRLPPEHELAGEPDQQPAHGSACSADLHSHGPSVSRPRRKRMTEGSKSTSPTRRSRTRVASCGCNEDRPYGVIELRQSRPSGPQLGNRSLMRAPRARQRRPSSPARSCRLAPDAPGPCQTTRGGLAFAAVRTAQRREAKSQRRRPRAAQGAGVSRALAGAPGRCRGSGPDRRYQRRCMPSCRPSR